MKLKMKTTYYKLRNARTKNMKMMKTTIFHIIIGGGLVLLLCFFKNDIITSSYSDIIIDMTRSTTTY